MAQWSDLKIFGGSSGGVLAGRICQFLGHPQGRAETLKFSDGNIFVRVNESVRNCDVYLVQSIGMNPNEEFTEILFWMDAFRRASARSVTAVIPYFGYAKGDKKDESRVSIRARVCADCIENSGAGRVITLDLHSPQIQGFFRVPVDHIFARPLLVQAVKDLGLDNPVVVSPDAGYMKSARQFAEAGGWDVAVGDKIRRDHDEQAKVLQIIGDVQGRDAVICDDFSISGGTLFDLALGLKERGAGRIVAVLSHILMGEKALNKLENSPIETIISTDTLENPLLQTGRKVEILSSAPLFAEAIRRVHFQESLSALFDGPGQFSQEILQAARDLSRGAP